MVRPRVTFYAVALICCSTFSAADTDFSSAGMNRSILLTPVQVVEANPSVSGTNFRPLRNETITPFEDAMSATSGTEFGASISTWERPSRPSVSIQDVVTSEVLRPERSLRAALEEAQVPAPVPEPASIALVASGLLSLGLRRRKK